MQSYISRVIKAIKQFNLIDEGDIVVVGVSGGKDSMLTTLLLHEISKFYQPKFTVIPVSLDCTGGEATKSDAYKPTIDFLKSHGIDLHIVPCDVLKIVFEDRKETNPCSLCANLRRGKLNAYAKSLGARKVALGHHMDDFIETFFMNMFYGGRLYSFLPKTYFDRIDITQIRPMLYLKESEIITACKKFGIPILHNCCEVNGKTQRQFAKEELARMKKIFPDAKKNMFRAALSSIEKDIEKEMNTKNDSK